MSSFLNTRSSRLEVSCKKDVLHIKILENSLKKVRDAVFNLINFRLKVYNFIEKGLQHMCFPKNSADVLRTPILQNAARRLLLKYLLKIKIAAPDKLSEAAVRRYFSKWVFLKISH